MPTEKKSSRAFTWLFGPIDAESTWVHSYGYAHKGTKNGVVVTFLDGTTVMYPDTEVRDYQYLNRASSKGRAIWRRFYNLNYNILSPTE